MDLSDLSVPSKMTGVRSFYKTFDIEIPTMQRIIHDGIEKKVLAEILKENYGITGACCRDLIERIQLELDM